MPSASPTISLPPQVEADVLFEIDATTEHQTMEGFGATHLSLVYQGQAGDVLSPSLRAQAIDAVYGQVGISMGNLEAALLESPGTYDQRQNDDDDPFNIDPAGFQPFGTIAMKDKVVDLAEPLGFDNFYLSQRINLRWTSPWLEDIRDDDYERFLDEAAEQVVAGQIYWRDNFGVVPRFQLLFNEPLSGNRELSGGNVQEVVDIVKRAGERLRDEGFQDIKLVVPSEETEEKSLAVARAILSDPDARRYVGAIAYHPYPYGSAYASVPRILRTSGAGKPDSGRIEVRTELRELSRQYGVGLWMTEVSHGEVNPLSFDAVRGRAVHIHDELIYADAAAYFGMNSMWDSVSHELHFGNDDLFSEMDTIVLIENEEERVHITGMGYAIGHYARWVPRGTVRVEATSSDPLVMVTAFRDDEQDRLVLVIINNAEDERTVEVRLRGARFSGELDGEQSTMDVRWRPLIFEGDSEADGFVISVPAESVVTIAAQLQRP